MISQSVRPTLAEKRKRREKMSRFSAKTAHTHNKRNTNSSKEIDLRNNNSSTEMQCLGFFPPCSNKKNKRTPLFLGQFVTPAHRACNAKSNVRLACQKAVDVSTLKNKTAKFKKKKKK